MSTRYVVAFIKRSMDHSSLNTTIYVGNKCLRIAFKIYKNITYLPSLIHSARRKAKTRIPKGSQRTKLAYQLGVFHLTETPQTRKPTQKS